MSEILSISSRVRDNMSQTARAASFVRFINEREAIRLKKESGIAQMAWTKDSILAMYHFCNVRRSDDRVTKWIGDWALGFPSANAWFAYVVARWFNEPATLYRLRPALDNGTWKPGTARNAVRQMISRGDKVFRAAYIISGAIAGAGQKKYDAVIDKVLTPLWKDPVDIVENSCEQSWLNLRERPGMGSFMAGQIVADWQTFGVINGEDRCSWAPLGPGSKRGLNWIHRRKDINASIRQDDAVQEMVDLFRVLARHHPKLAGSMTLHDLQNCLCEFSKYVRGYAKIRYKPFKGGKF